MMLDEEFRRDIYVEKNIRLVTEGTQTDEKVLVSVGSQGPCTCTHLRGAENPRFLPLSGRSWG